MMHASRGVCSGGIWCLEGLQKPGELWHNIVPNNDNGGLTVCWGHQSNVFIYL